MQNVILLVTSPGEERSFEFCGVVWRRMKGMMCCFLRASKDLVSAEQANNKIHKICFSHSGKTVLKRFCSLSGCWECAFTCLALGVVGGRVSMKYGSTHTTFKKNISILLPAIDGVLVTSFESVL